jgi:hypothetical protein
VLTLIKQINPNSFNFNVSSRGYPDPAFLPLITPLDANERKKSTH